MAGYKYESKGVASAATPMLLFAPAVLFLIVFFFGPLATLLFRSVTDPTVGLQNYTHLLGDETFRRILWLTLVFSGCITLCTLLVGFPVAWYIAIAPKVRANAVLAVVVLSMWSSALARIYAWLVLLQDGGPINSLLISTGLASGPVPLVHNTVGGLIGMTYIMLPFMIMPIYATANNIDAALMSAAAICGGNPFYIFRRVLLPLTAPGIGTGCVMVFVLSLGYFIVPAMLGSSQQIVMSGFVYSEIQNQLDWGTGSAAAFILLAVTLAIYALYYVLMRPDAKR